MSSSSFADRTVLLSTRRSKKLNAHLHPLSEAEFRELDLALTAAGVLQCTIDEIQDLIYRCFAPDKISAGLMEKDEQGRLKVVSCVNAYERNINVPCDEQYTSVRDMKLYLSVADQSEPAAAAKSIALSAANYRNPAGAGKMAMAVDVIVTSVEKKLQRNPLGWPCIQWKIQYVIYVENAAIISPTPATPAPAPAPARTPAKPEAKPQTMTRAFEQLGEVGIAMQTITAVLNAMEEEEEQGERQ